MNVNRDSGPDIVFKVGVNRFALPFMGILLAHEVTGTELVDGGKWVEITADNGLKHLVGKGDLVVVAF